MKKVGIIYEITNNPYFGKVQENYSNKLSEYVKPSEINWICEAFTNLGFDYQLIDGAEGLLKQKDHFKEFDLFFNKSIGFKGLERKIIVPSIGQLYHLPMLGTSGYAMTLARHKYHTNRLLKGMGFPVPFAYYFERKEQISKIHKYPVIVKPNAESDALGISERSVCYSFSEVEEKAEELIYDFNQPIIIEEFIPGEEWKVAVIGNNEKTKACGCVNTLKNGLSMNGTLQTREDILNNNLSYDIPQNTSLVTKALSMSEKIHSLLGLNDYSRCDFRIDETGKLYCMEVSTHPYISGKTSSFVMAAMQTFSNFNAVMKQIVDAALKRYR
ncbi:ATP-grasp domain-containing protein [Culturomica massiliensis]|uniref:ATP-grasp domain-containing protein n=1 Tax=Culturomica massiliensis TaxID=1841857 RepID=UPI003AB37524